MFILYQYLIAFPILVAITLVTCIVTVLFAPWKNSTIPHVAQMIWARSVYRLLFIRVQVSGLEHIRPNQSYVFAANHQSFLDVFVIYGWLPVVFKWMMKKELRKIPIVGFVCKVAGHVFVDRTNPVAAMQSLRLLENELKGGVSTVIFPEGTRTHTGEVGKFKRGAFRVACDLSLPIIPISLTGCFEAMPRTDWKVSPRAHVHMHVGEPVDLTQFASIDEAIEYVRTKVMEGMD